MWGFISSVFSGGALGTIEKIASEMIETDMESAEAKSLFIKTLDPNGIMRRQLSKFACYAYGYYLFVTSVLVFVVAFKVGDIEGARIAMEGMTELFTPITVSWAGIVSASFGVNGMNSYKGQ
jgi:hypothetical protein